VSGTSTHPAPAGELEREPLCPVKWCPFPTSPEFHECWCGRLDVEHHHVDPRGMGGSPERRDDPDNIQCVCPPHHKAVTTEGYTDEIKDGYYIMRNPKGAQLVKHPRYRGEPTRRLSAAAEADIRTDAPPSVSVAAPSTKEQHFDELSALTDEDLVGMYLWGKAMAGKGILTMCQAVAGYRRRHCYRRGDDSWLATTEGAGFEESPSKLQYMAEWGDLFNQNVLNDSKHVVEAMGQFEWGPIAFIGRLAEDKRQQALEAAVELLADRGECKTKWLAAKFAEEIYVPPEIPAGLFATIVADPPWPYSNQATRGAAEDHYQTMTLEELAALPLTERAAPDAHLYLWVTNAFLPDAFEIVKSWGFEYKTLLTWVKPQMGMGNYFRNVTEHVLFCVRGRLRTLSKDTINVINARRTQHSEKPEAFYQLVEKSSPGPYLELFARRERDGWQVWGDEV